MDPDGIILNFHDGMTVDELHDHFGVEKDAIRAIIRFYRQEQMKMSA